MPWEERRLTNSAPDKSRVGYRITSEYGKKGIARSQSMAVSKTGGVLLLSPLRSLARAKTAKIP